MNTYRVVCLGDDEVHFVDADELSLYDCVVWFYKKGGKVAGVFPVHSLVSIIKIELCPECVERKERHKEIEDIPY